MSKQRLSSSVRQTLNGPRQGAAQISPRCALARSARNYSCSSSLLLPGRSGVRLDSPPAARHHPPRIPRTRSLVRPASTDATASPSASPFPSPFDDQPAPPKFTTLSQNDYVARSLRVNPGTSRARSRNPSDRPPVEKHDPFDKRRVHPTAPCSGKEVVEFFQSLFAPLEFPEDLALRVITHMSWLGGIEGHHARFVFLGRRALRASTFMFLQSPEVHNPQSKYDIAPWNEAVASAAAQMLDTHVLGKEVGRVWELERVMRWIPHIPDSTDIDRVLLSSGLLKVRGATVEAVIGGLVHQHGGLVAHRAFLTRVLPHLKHLLPPLHRDAATRVIAKMGGVNAPLALLSKETLGQVEGQREREEKPDEPAVPPPRQDPIGARDARQEFQRSKPVAAAAPSHSKVLLMG
ncbi:hypothetical protein CALCODRAFT_471246 [Calocera cornea HHB12733]|uniref:RNase III domain-containing protein n=1 Tax=Calocera cornea HHB12733 TaxID=1353952 RepID=A0A165F682_9BASI|nr:hypothetical protein CALCODRAFT_471246 [Calocera cornea HHB12733]